MSNKVSQTQRPILHSFLSMWKPDLNMKGTKASVEQLGRGTSRRKDNRVLGVGQAHHMTAL